MDRVMRSSVASLLCVVAVAMLCVPGCRQSGTQSNGPRLAFVTNGVASFWTVAAVGARRAGADLGADVDVIMPSGLADQTRKLEDLITRGIDGIAVSPINSENQIDVLNKAAAATVLITQDSDAPSSDRMAYIGMDNYVAGRMCGQLVRDSLPDGGEVMLFIGRVDQDNAQARRQGCIDAILGRDADPTRRDDPNATPESEDGKYRILGTLTDRLDAAKAKANAEDTLTRHPDIAAMVGLFVGNPPAILAALERAGKVGKVKVIGFDEDEVTLQGVVDGHIVGTVVQDPYKYGYESVRIMLALHADKNAELPENGYIDVPPRLITKGNVDGFWKELKERLAPAE